MAQNNYQNQYGAGRTYTDDYGNLVPGDGAIGGAYEAGGFGATGNRPADEYGRVLDHASVGTSDAYGAGGYEPIDTVVYGVTGRGMVTEQYYGQGLGDGHLRRFGSSSSSSSSSEDDVQGGRRRKEKGLKGKIMEKLPGGERSTEQPHMSTTMPGQVGGYSHGHEKKGIMDKIKEKLQPGSHHH